MFNKIRKKLLKARFVPIEVFCFHHVSMVRNPLICAEEDWTQTDQFKQNIVKLQSEYEFISLSKAYSHIVRDKWRRKKYAVLTADDAYKSLLSIIPWLDENKVPLTIFVNSKFLDQNAMTPIHEEYLNSIDDTINKVEVLRETYLSKAELWSLKNNNSIEVGLHGHEHLDVRKLNEIELSDEVENCIKILNDHPCYIPFYAYPWGYYTESTNRFLLYRGIIPVMVSGAKNYNNKDYVDRKCIDGLAM